MRKEKIRLANNDGPANKTRCATPTDCRVSFFPSFSFWWLVNGLKPGRWRISTGDNLFTDRRRSALNPIELGQRT